MKPLTKILEDLLTLNNARDTIAEQMRNKRTELTNINTEISTLSQSIPGIISADKFIYKKFLFTVRGDQVEISKLHEHTDTEN
jgi:hypothetical protein